MEEILPPRVEDAGLEDCALPPDSIQEAFRKAAAAVGARAASIFSDGGCTADPFPSRPSDALMGMTDGVDPAPGPCEAERGGVTEVVGDEVAAVGTEAEEKVEDAVVVGQGKLPEKGEACVDGLRGVEVGERDGDEEEEEEERDGERPILTEAYV